MNGQVLKVKFKQDKAYLTEDYSLNFKQLDLPTFVNSFTSPAYWTIKILNYNELEKSIFCDVLSYHIGETEFSESQKHLSKKLGDIKKILFYNIETNSLIKTSTGSRPNAYSAKNIRTYGHNSISKSLHVEKKPENISIEDTFKIPINNVHFQFGGVSVNKKFVSYEDTIELLIKNDFIIEEYDAIKNYFENVLRTKNINVTVHIEIIDNKITIIEATSPEISRINKQIIEDVKLEFVRAIIKKKIDTESELFTIEEYFNTIPDEIINSNIFYNDDKGLLNDLTKISNSKHYNHLRFLSSKHSYNQIKLRYIHKPFSFIFLIEGIQNNHIVWETLNTKEATYIWHINKNPLTLEKTLKNIDKILKTMKTYGKFAYISSTQDAFTRIYHDYSDPNKGFKSWKNTLERLLL